MSSEKSNIKELIKRDIQGLLSAKEVAYLRTQQRMYDQEEWDELVADAVFDLADSGYESPGWEQADDAEHVMRRVSQHRQTGQTRWLYFSRAAAVILVGIVGYWSLSNNQFQFGRPEVYQVAGCGELPKANPLPLREFGVSFSTHDPLVPRGERFIRPGAIGMLEQQGEWNVLRDRAGRFLLSRIKDMQKQTSLPALEKWGFSMAVANPAWRDWGQQAARMEQGIFGFSTAAQQQAEIEMPGGMTIRLNASSSLQYAEDAAIGLIGEGYVVQRNHEDKLDRLPVETADILISSPSKTARYTLLTTAYSTRVTLLEGTLHITSKRTGREWILKQKDTNYLFSFTSLTEGRPAQELMNSTKLPHYARPLAWTLPIRAYNQIKVKDYILEMARWYGVEVEGLDCVDDQFIHVRTCFRNSLDQFIEGLNGMDVAARFMHGKLYLCKAHTGAPLAE